MAKGQVRIIAGNHAGETGEHYSTIQGIAIVLLNNEEGFGFGDEIEVPVKFIEPIESIASLFDDPEEIDEEED